MYRQKRRSVLKPSNESLLLYYDPDVSQSCCCNIRFSVRYTVLTGKYLPTSTSKRTCLFFTFMGPCIVNVFKHNQQDTTLHNGIYYYKCSTCFRRFLRSSSEAQNCIDSIGYLSSIFCYREWVGNHYREFQLTIAVRSRKMSTNTRCCVYSFQILMIGGGTA
jgi:hypothetical protein